MYRLISHCAEYVSVFMEQYKIPDYKFRCKIHCRMVYATYLNRNRKRIFEF